MSPHAPVWPATPNVATADTPFIDANVPAAAPPVAVILRGFASAPRCRSPLFCAGRDGPHRQPPTRVARTRRAPAHPERERHGTVPTCGADTRPRTLAARAACACGGRAARGCTADVDVARDAVGEVDAADAAPQVAEHAPHRSAWNAYGRVHSLFVLHACAPRARFAAVSRAKSRVGPRRASGIRGDARARTRARAHACVRERVCARVRAGASGRLPAS
jgi:hypothetical protein